MLWSYNLVKAFHFHRNETPDTAQPRVVTTEIILGLELSDWFLIFVIGSFHINSTKVEKCLLKNYIKFGLCVGNIMVASKEKYFVFKIYGVGARASSKMKFPQLCCVPTTLYCAVTF